MLADRVHADLFRAALAERGLVPGSTDVVDQARVPRAVGRHHPHLRLRRGHRAGRASRNRDGVGAPFSSRCSAACGPRSPGSSASRSPFTRLRVWCSRRCRGPRARSTRPRCIWRSPAWAVWSPPSRGHSWRLVVPVARTGRARRGRPGLRSPSSAEAGHLRADVPEARGGGVVERGVRGLHDLALVEVLAGDAVDVG